MGGAEATKRAVGDGFVAWISDKLSADDNVDVEQSSVSEFEVSAEAQGKDDVVEIEAAPEDEEIEEIFASSSVDGKDGTGNNGTGDVTADDEAGASAIAVSAAVGVLAAALVF